MHRLIFKKRPAVLGLYFAIAGCGSGSQDIAKEATPVVTVVTLQRQSVPLSRSFPGKTSAYLIAEVRPQVGGIVQRRRFVEGSNVRAGEVLYDLDDSMYRSEFDSAKANQLKTQAVLVAARLAASRSVQLRHSEVISAQDHERTMASLGEAEADVAAAQAAVAGSAIKVAYAHIVAPINGRIGKSSVTQGALVSVGQAAALATIQQLDPIYVDVSQSSNEWLALKQEIVSGRVQSDRGGTPVRIVLENGNAYPEDGKLQFADVTVDPTTGSMMLRVIVPNPNLLLLPGMYVRAELSEGLLTQGLLAPQIGITRDVKGNGVAMVVNQESKVESRTVTVSRTVGDAWVVEQGLSAGDRLIVEGLQKVQPDMLVQVIEQPPPPGAPANR